MPQASRSPLARRLCDDGFRVTCLRAAGVCLAAMMCGGLGAEAGAKDSRPNILWLTCEDNNINWIGCYGNPHADTPNIDRLASEGFRYSHCYANAPVCAPSRSTWITGMHAISLGTHPMRSRYAIPHDRIPYYPDLLKQAGYFVGNAGKTDYNIGGRDDREAWDTKKAKWSEMKRKQPFFMIINSTKSHESKAFGDVSQTSHSPNQVRLAKYHPDVPAIRQNYAHYHDQIRKMDADIGEALEGLEKAGLAENTIVVYNSDHGGVLPRSKRFLFNSGTHCPLVIRIPERFKHLRPGKPGTTVERLVSFIDMTKTWLELCDAPTPGHLQGRVFLGPNAEEREYHVSFRGRMDERCDNVRAIRDRRYLLIRNYMPYVPRGQHLNYLWTMEATRAWEEHHREGQTDAVTGRFFETKSSVELYDTRLDPDNVKNLADDPDYAAEIRRLSEALDRWQVKHFDSGLLPESEVVRRAQAADKTIFDWVRDRRAYDIPRLQSAAALALEREAGNLPRLLVDLSDTDPGVRYWAVVGCFLLQQEGVKIPQDQLVRACSDSDSDHVRLMAAWALYNGGDRATARACLNDLFRRSSYASLKAFNVVDLIGDGVEPFRQAMMQCHFSHGGYVNRMKTHLGIPEHDEPRRGK